MSQAGIGICLIAIGIGDLLILWQLNNFGKRLKKLEEQQINSKNE